MGPLLSYGASIPSPSLDLNGVSATSVWAKVRRGQGHVILKQDKSRVKQIQEYFDAMATDEERKMFSPLLMGAGAGAGAATDEGEKRRVLDLLNVLMVARLAQGFKDAGVKVPRNLQKNKQGVWPSLPSSGLQDRLGALKKVFTVNSKGEKVPADFPADKEDFAKFRRDFKR